MVSEPRNVYFYKKNKNLFINNFYKLQNILLPQNEKEAN